VSVSFRLPLYCATVQPFFASEIPSTNNHKKKKDIKHKTKPFRKLKRQNKKQREQQEVSVAEGAPPKKENSKHTAQKPPKDLKTMGTIFFLSATRSKTEKA